MAVSDGDWWIVLALDGIDDVVGIMEDEVVTGKTTLFLLITVEIMIIHTQILIAYSH